MKRLGVHVFVKNRELGEIVQFAVFRLAFQAPQHALQYFGLVGTGCFQIGEGQAPARIVRHFRRVVQSVAAAHDGFHSRVLPPAPQAPVLLEPGDVSQLPQRRIDDCKLGPEQPLAVEIVGDARKMPAARTQLAGEGIGVHRGGRLRMHSSAWLLLFVG